MSKPNGRGWRADALKVREKRGRDVRIAKAKAVKPAVDPQLNHSIESEQGALGCVIMAGDDISQSEVDELLNQLKPSHFYDVRHAQIHEAARALRASNHAVTTITLMEWLKGRKLLEGIGGVSYLATLIDSIPSVMNFGYYLDVLKEKAHRRWFAKKGDELKAMAGADVVSLEDSRARLTELLEATESVTTRTLIEIITPAEARAFVADPADYLVGAGLIARDQFVTIGGEPGCGKSRLATTLAVGLARGSGTWQGYPVRSQGRTLILQTENKGNRLKEEFEAVPAQFDDWIRISKTLPNGLAFAQADFRRELSRIFDKWPFELLVIDPWNDVVSDEGQNDYSDALLNIEACFRGRKMPGVVIVAHLRKPRADASGRRKSGRELLHELSGSLKLGSKSRTVFAVQPATASMDDDRIVFEVAKANDADPDWLKEHGTRSAWHRKNGAFESCREFDWDEWMHPGAPNSEKRSVSMDMVREVFTAARRQGMKAGELVRAIAQRFDVGESTVWRAIKEGSGYLSPKLNHAAGVVALKKEEQ